MTRTQRCGAEFAGTALLLAIVICSGIMGERLAAGNAGVALLANTLATVAGLFVLIEVFGPLSGAHFNPLVSAVMAWRGELARRELPFYVLAQLAGAAFGAWLAQAMFELPFPQWSTNLRGGAGQWLAEAVATAGLIFVILRAPPARASALVAAWIGAAYWLPHRPRSPTRPPLSAGCGATALPASPPPACPASCSRNASARWSGWPCTAPSTAQRCVERVVTQAPIAAEHRAA